MGRRSQMRLLLLLAAVLPLLSGCTWFGPMVEVEGQTYRALRKVEEELLVEVARRYLKKNTPKVVSIHECDIALRSDPDLKIDYTGDRCGEARVTWEMPTRWLTVLFIGRFLEKDMYCVLEEKQKMSKLIDFRPKNDPSRYVTPTFPRNAGEAPAPAGGTPAGGSRKQAPTRR